MHISRIKTENFRNLKNFEVEFNQDFVILVGPNASGKTNFLESIFYGSVLQAFPPGKSWEMIDFDHEYFRVELDVEGMKLAYYYGRKDDKRYVRSQSIDGVKKKSRDMLGILPTVSFLPQDLNLLQLSPQLRRDYLDEVLVQSEPDYEDMIAEYSRVLTQRNELLSRISAGQAAEGELAFWDEKIASLGARIMGARAQLSEYIDADLTEVYHELTGAYVDLHFVYSTPSGISEITRDALLDRLGNSRREDIASSRTSTGPHRDDWRLEDTNARNLSHFLSRGEQRSSIIALKMQELRFLKKTLDQEPVILLDELLAELDRSRQQQILRSLPPDTQKFLTTTDLEGIPDEVRNRAQIVEFGTG